MKAIAKCPLCSKPVYNIISHTWRGPIPKFKVINGIVFHGNCAKRYELAKVKNTQIGFNMAGFSIQREI